MLKRNEHFKEKVTVSYHLGPVEIKWTGAGECTLPQVSTSQSSVLASTLPFCSLPRPANGCGTQLSHSSHKACL